MKMKSKLCGSLVAVLAAASLAACGSDSSAESTSSIHWETIPQTTEASSEASTEEETSGELPAGTYRSELTGEPISEDLKDQRPVAIMVDNEKTALPHYGTAKADIVYELMNSTANDRITRLMCVYKDWQGDDSAEQIGSIRSTRPTNIILCAEYNAVLCHDGGPFYNDPYFEEGIVEHFSGNFPRVSNGKDIEFTEYVTKDSLVSRFESTGYSTTYNENAPSRDSHFTFADYGTTVDLSETGGDNVVDATDIKLPFKHNSSELKYNEETGLYDYYDYGELHKDADTEDTMSFTNVILQDCSFTQYDENGYLIYNCIGLDQGWYITGGKAMPITWEKADEKDITKYYDADHNEIQINQGKTYISLVPSDGWDSLTLN